jgi:hypothetical protein
VAEVGEEAQRLPLLAVLVVLVVVAQAALPEVAQAQMVLLPLVEVEVGEEAELFLP